jgi:osmoprotectant transport system permease protein
MNALLALALFAAPEKISVGSKVFTESVILGEIVTQLAADAGADATHHAQLGGTQVVWKALLAGEIDVYPEYTGTIAQEILGLAGGAAADEDSLRRALAERHVIMSAPLGFNDTYAIGMKAATAERLKIARLSDLAAHPELNLGFSSEFMDRADGWPALRDAYGLAALANVRGLDHDLAYRALDSGSIDATDLYSTDAEIRYYGLRVLEDDRHHFPAYQAVLLLRDDLAKRAPRAVAALGRLHGAIDEQAMIDLNARAKIDKMPERRVAEDFLAQKLGVTGQPRRASASNGMLARLLGNTRDHMVLVGLSLAAAILLAVPLGIFAARRPRAGQLILGVVGVVQTIPSLALLVFMIPFFGIGAPPAVIALFLYSLLPIVRNTCTGLRDIPPSLVEAAAAIGLRPGPRLRLVELPMASRAILAGIKTSAVINVGTATLGALIGAGGYGQPIMTGIRLDNVGLILEGAVPAAVLALAAQGVFEVLERVLVPRGLRLTSRAE